MSVAIRPTLALLLLLGFLSSPAPAAEPPAPPPFEPPGYDMREFFPLEPAGTTWRYEDGENWVELTTRGLQEFDGNPAFRLDAVSNGADVGARYFTPSGRLQVLYVDVPGHGDADFREDPLSFSSGARAYLGDRISSVPRSFMGGQIQMTVEVISVSEVTVPAGTYPEALRLHTTMTHLPSEAVIAEFDSVYARHVGMIWTSGTEAGPDGTPVPYDQKLVEIRSPRAD